MNSQDYWQLFVESGSPEFYLMYNNAKKMEAADVFNRSGVSVESNTLQ